MFDNANPYTLRTEISGGITRYYVTFKDGQAVLREAEVSRSVYMEFLRFIKVERNLRRWDERHIEQITLSDEELYKRALYRPKSLEETVCDSWQNERLWLAIRQLPEIQRRRLVLYHEFGLTYEQIAEIEGCKKQSVCESVIRAEEIIKRKMKNY